MRGSGSIIEEKADRIRTQGPVIVGKYVRSFWPLTYSSYVPYSSGIGGTTRKTVVQSIRMIENLGPVIALKISFLIEIGGGVAWFRHKR